ncbi:DUF2244 domain-containing protein [Paracoccus pacificus]|uniref:DUF2244 domain-containing protein n=1 Tax=Paracoccus pacificus TaxID=1463598 RepID=A0ABW4RDM6_9RHOB
MPYSWQDSGTGPAVTRLNLWPHRSLPVTGFVWVIGITAVMLAIPMLALVGTPALWGLLPFAAIAVAALWWAIRYSYRGGQTQELLVIREDALSLTRKDPGRPDRHWQANPHWVRVNLRDGPVEDYLTLTDGQRAVELGAFLSPEERRQLAAELRQQLTRRRHG